MQIRRQKLQAKTKKCFELEKNAKLVMTKLSITSLLQTNGPFKYFLLVLASCLVYELLIVRIPLMKPMQS
jgi:hypothetical protein